MWEGADVDLGRLPVQTCWPGDAGPLITWGLTVTRGPLKKRQNLGIYRQQVIAPQQGDHALARPPRRRARFPRPRARASRDAVPGRRRARRRSRDHPRRGHAGARLAVRIPVRRPAARQPHRDRQVPRRTTCRCRRRAEIVLEGFMRPDASDPTGYETAAEGPFGDHTGYYNEVERFPVFTIERITLRRDPIYHSHLHRQAARRAGDPRRGAERGVRAAAAEAVPGDRRLLPAARGLQLPPRRGVAEEAVPRPRQARDVRRLELPAPVHVHQVHRRHRRRRRTSATGRT